jgi:hypothetical protein
MRKPFDVDSLWDKDERDPLETEHASQRARQPTKRRPKRVRATRFLYTKGSSGNS